MKGWEISDDVSGDLDRALTERQAELESDPQPCFICCQVLTLELVSRATCYSLRVDGRTAVLIPTCDVHWEKPDV